MGNVATSVANSITSSYGDKIEEKFANETYTEFFDSKKDYPVYTKFMFIGTDNFLGVKHKTKYVLMIIDKSEKKYEFEVTEGSDESIFEINSGDGPYQSPLYAGTNIWWLKSHFNSSFDDAVMKVDVP